MALDDSHKKELLFWNQPHSLNKISVDETTTTYTVLDEQFIIDDINKTIPAEIMQCLFNFLPNDSNRSSVTSNDSDSTTQTFIAPSNLAFLAGIYPPPQVPAVHTRGAHGLSSSSTNSSSLSAVSSITEKMEAQRQINEMIKENETLKAKIAARDEAVLNLQTKYETATDANSKAKNTAASLIKQQKTELNSLKGDAVRLLLIIYFLDLKYID